MLVLSDYFVTLLQFPILFIFYLEFLFVFGCFSEPHVGFSLKRLAFGCRVHQESLQHLVVVVLVQWCHPNKQCSCSSLQVPGVLLVSPLRGQEECYKDPWHSWRRPQATQGCQKDVGDGGGGGGGAEAGEEGVGEDAEHWTMGLPLKPSHMMELSVVHMFEICVI